jgi:hypothetical protein
MCVFFSFQALYETFLVLRRIELDLIRYMYGLHEDQDIYIYIYIYIGLHVNYVIF